MEPEKNRRFISKFFFCIPLQKGIFASSMLTSTVWFLIILLYIPYVIYLAPFEYERKGDITSERLPASDYGSGSLSAVMVLIALFVDSLLIAGVYKKYEVKTDLLVPWLLYYPLVIIGLLVTGIMILIYGDEYASYFAVIPFFVGLWFIYMWVSVASLYKYGNPKKNIVMTELSNIALGTLTSKLITDQEKLQINVT